MTENKNKLSLPTRIGICFFAVIMALSVISRFTASAVIPKISVTSAGRQSISYDITGIASVKSKSSSYISVEPNYKISSVMVNVGDTVEENQPLFSYDLNDLNSAYKQLIYDALQISTGIDIDYLEDTKQSLSDTLKEKEDNVLSAEQDIDEAKEKLNIEILEWQKDCKKEYEDKEKEFSEFENKNESILRAKRAVEDAELTYNKASKDYFSVMTSADESTLRQLEYSYDQARDNLTRARNDLEVTRKENRNDLDEYKEKIAELKEKYEQSLKETIDNQTEYGKKANDVVLARESLESAQKSLKKAKDELEKARQSDLIKGQNDDIDKIIKDKQTELDKLNLDMKNSQLDTVKKLIVDNGIVYSNRSGVITELNLEVGKTAGPNSIAEISDKKYCIVGSIPSENAKDVRVGDNVEVKYSGNNKEDTKITSIKIADDGTAEFTADITYEEISVNTKINFKISVNMGIFERCLPYQALRSDSKQKYVLVVREKEGILGTELVLVKIPVIVTAENQYTIAVDDSFNSTDKVVIDSSKNVNEGDKVRYYEN